MRPCRGIRVWVLALAAATLALAQPVAEQSVLIDSFDDASRWSTSASEGVSASVRGEDEALCLQFDFNGRAGYAVARRAVDLPLPPNYRFRFRLRGSGPANNLEFKLVDDSGENVWWNNRRAFAPPGEWVEMTLKKRQLAFAWGPAGGGELRHAAAIELAVTAGEGGSGTLCIDDLALDVLPAPSSGSARTYITASSASPSAPAESAVDGDAGTSWYSGPAAASADLTLDFGAPREYGGLIIDWANSRAARRAIIEASDDGTTWRTLRTISGTDGVRNYVPTQEAESRYVRLRLAEATGNGFEIREIAVKPLEFSTSMNAVYEAIAAGQPPGSFPRAYIRQQTYWTILGADGDEVKSLMSEDGAVEPGVGGFSIEPFIYDGSKLITWNDVCSSQSLHDGFLPVPTVTWDHPQVRLRVTAFVGGRPGASRLCLLYRSQNRSPEPITGRLFLAIRPLQVNPPQQFLNHPGGVGRVSALRRWEGGVLVDGVPVSVVAGDALELGAAAFDEGDITGYLRRGGVPVHEELADPSNLASGAIALPMRLGPGEEKAAAVVIPLHGSAPPADLSTIEQIEREHESVLQWWCERLGRVKLDLPPPAADFAAAVRASVAYVLINREGPSLRPGSRAYARTWIRDASLTSSALLRLGYEREVGEFLRWFVRYQFPSGRVPCCVDRRGADPVPENDSNGQMIFAVAEHYRYARDEQFLAEMWPHVRAAAESIDTMRGQRRTAAYLLPEKLRFFGLLPESISHEGYSSKPMHSYWDDFFALRGLEDAAMIARVLGESEAAARFTFSAKQMRAEVAASIRRTITETGIRYVPGCAELGDFDPTSTSIALSPCGVEDVLPADALRHTFTRYVEEIRAKARGSMPWEAYTPYELRNVGALLRLNMRREATEILGWLMAGQRPTGWRQWAEVVGREARQPRFIGDMPHTWVATDFVRSFLDMLAYQRTSDGAVVVASGVPADWLEANKRIRATGIRTPAGTIDIEIDASAKTVRYRLSGDLIMTTGGIVLPLPLREAPHRISVNGSPASPSQRGEIVLRDLPAEIVLSYL